MYALQSLLLRSCHLLAGKKIFFFKFKTSSFPTSLKCCSLPQSSFAKIMLPGKPRPLYFCISDNHLGNYRQLALPSNAGFSFPSPPGDHELARTCSASLAPDTEVLYPRPSVISNYCAHTSHSQRASYRMLRSLRRCVRSILALGFQGGFRSHLSRSTTPLPH